jgi:DNA recombination protein RmuC
LAGSSAAPWPTGRQGWPSAKAFGDLDAQFRRAITELAGASERAARADELTRALEVARADVLRAQGDLATLRAQAQHFEEQKRLLIEARTG